MKKLLTLLLAIFATGALFAQTFTSNGINYKIISPTTVEVAQNFSITGAVVIPATVTNNSVNYQVTRLGENAFINCSSLTSVTIPNSVTSIGESAFSNCSGLTSLIIPNSVTSFGGGAFSNCNGLISITIPNTITSIERSEFFGCKSLTSVIIPNSVTSIADYAFYDCSGLTAVTIPNSVTSIGTSTFYNCTSLTSLSLPSTITSIGVAAFSSCSGLTSLAIPNSVTSIANESFYYCSGLTSITIPNSVTSIGKSAFSYCYGLTSIAIPNSVTSIGQSAFSYCWGATSVAIPNSVTSIGFRSFDNCRRLISVSIPNSVTSIGELAFSGTSDLKSITVNWATPLPINRNVFYGRTSLSGITLNVPVGMVPVYDAALVWTEFNPIVEQGVQPVLNQTFTANGINYIVTKATLPYEVVVSSNTSFVGVATIPATVTNTGNSFEVTSIGNNAFQGCTGLTSITIPNSVTSIGSWAFYNSLNLSSITIPSSVTSIGKLAFIYCYALTSVTIPNSVTSIGNNAFTFCSGLTSITIPNSVTSIGNGVFDECTGLTSVIIPNSVSSIGIVAFRNCRGLNSVTIPNSVTSIGDYAFDGCSVLTTISIPNSVISIGNSAFSTCTGLTSVTVDWPTPLGINANVFGNVPITTATLNVPAGTATAYDAAAVWTDFGTITTTPPPAPTAQAQTFCGATTVAGLTATGTAIKWYNIATGGTALNSSTAISTGNYYATQTINNIESARTPVNVTVGTIPAAPTLQSQTICGVQTLGNLVPAESGLKVYTVATGGLPLTSSTTITTGTFYVSQTIGTCESTRTAVVVTVTSPAAPILQAQTICGVQTLGNLVPANSGIKLYTVATGGLPLTSSTTLTTGTYYVTQTVGTCESARTPVSITVNLPIAPTAQAQSFCGATTVSSLLAIGTGTIKWYNVATGGTALTSGTAISTRNYFVSQTIGTCESARTQVAVTVGTIPAAPILQAQTICGVQTLGNLVPANSGIKLYTVATGGTALANTATITTGTYYVSQTSGTCESARTLVSITVNNVSAPTGNANQSFTTGATLANIVANPTSISWYATQAFANANTNILPQNTVLVNGSTYFGVLVSGTCRSSALAVTVSVSANQSLKVSSLSLNVDAPLKQISIYPNPVTNGELNIIAGNEAIKSLSLINLSGVKVIIIPKVSNPKEVIVNTQGLTKGVYLLEIKDEQSTTVRKVIID